LFIHTPSIHSGDHFLLPQTIFLFRQNPVFSLRPLLSQSTQGTGQQRFIPQRIPRVLQQVIQAGCRNATVIYQKLPNGRFLCCLSGAGRQFLLFPLGLSASDAWPKRLLHQYSRKGLPSTRSFFRFQIHAGNPPISAIKEIAKAQTPSAFGKNSKRAANIFILSNQNTFDYW